MKPSVSKRPHLVLGTLGLCATLGALLTALPAAAAPVLSGAGSYTLGANTGAPGANASPTAACGNTGSDALVFTSAGVNSIGIHSYACDFGNSISFGSRSSGENTYFVDGTASVTGTITASGGNGLFFFVSGGQVGSFGSASFVAGEYQQSKLSISLVIDGITYLDDMWETMVGAGGAVSATDQHNGLMSVSSSGPTSGAGFISYGINGGGVFINIADGDYDISYVMTSMARGNVSSTTACRGTIYNGGNEALGRQPAFVEGGGDESGFASYCGAGAQSGDPFPPIARALPEPASSGLVAAALLALGALARRRRQS